MKHLKYLLIVGVMAGALAGCESTDMADATNAYPNRLEGIDKLMSRYGPKPAKVYTYTPHNRTLPIIEKPVPKSGGYLGGLTLTNKKSASFLAGLADNNVLSREIPMGERHQFTVDFDQASLKEIIDFIFQKYLKSPYVLAENFEDMPVNWKVEGKYFDKEIVELFETFLKLHNIKLSKYKNTFYVGKIDSTLPVNLSGPPAGFTTQIWKLRNVEAAELRPFIDQIRGERSILHIVPSNNMMIVSADNHTLAQVGEFVHRVDTAAVRGKNLMVYKPHHLNAKTLAALLQNLPTRVGLKAGGQAGAVEAEAIDENNSVVIVTASPKLKQTVEQFIAEVDQPGQDVRQVFYYTMRNQKAEEIHKTITALLPSLSLSDKEVGLVTHPGTNSLLISSTPEQYYELKKVIDRLDYDVPSAMIDATIVEVRLKDDLSYGVEWFLSGNGFGAAADATTSLTNSFISNPALEIGVVSLTKNTFATLQLLGKETDFNILSRPRVMVKNKATATIKSTDEIRLLKGQIISAVDQSGTSLPQVEFEKREFGITLEVTPKISDDGSITLKVDVEDSRRGPDDDTAGGGLQPTFNTRLVSTELIVHDGQTIMIGGMIQHTQNKVRDKVPILGDLPLIGYAFSNAYEEEQKTELVIFITPYIVTNASAARSISEALAGINLPAGI